MSRHFPDLFQDPRSVLSFSDRPRQGPSGQQFADFFSDPDKRIYATIR